MCHKGVSRHTENAGPEIREVKRVLSPSVRVRVRVRVCVHMHVCVCVCPHPIEVLTG